MSDESPVTKAAPSGAPVTGEYRTSATLLTIAAATCVVSVSCGRNAPPHTLWSCAISGSMRAGLCASMTWMSERWPRYASERRLRVRAAPGARPSRSTRG